MPDRDANGRFAPGNSIASLGGRARAKALPPERRREIARLGFQALVDQRFGGDAEAAKEYLGRLGAWASDAPYREPGSAVWPKFEHPGPMPEKGERHDPR